MALRRRRGQGFPYGVGELHRRFFDHRAISEYPGPGKAAAVRGNFLPEKRGLPIRRLERRDNGILKGL
jgi:hypothetical protein